MNCICITDLLIASLTFLKRLFDSPVVIIGIVTLIIAFQQWKISKNTLRFNLYKQRYQIYLTALKFTTQISAKQKVTFQQTLAFRRMTDPSKFLFKPEIQEYMNEIYSKSGQYRATIKSLEPLETKDQLGMRLTSDDSQKKTELENMKFKLLDYFEEQSNNQLTERFNKYLNFKNID